MAADAALAAIADQAREVARGWSGPGAGPGWDLVAALFDAVADDDALLRLAAEIPLDRLPALLAVASIQRVVADHPRDPLRRFYPGPGQQDVDASFAPALHAFVTTRAEEIRRWFDHRYQMNEVGRCTQVALAVGIVQRISGDRPLALIDLGAASGLGLNVDRYHVDLGRAGVLGPEDSPVRLTCTVTGDPPLPPGPPDIAVRVGIDVAPIDLDDPDARAWLMACTPPTTEAERRLAGAISVTRAVGAPVVAGDGARALSAVLDTVPRDLLVVVTDSYTAVFLDADERQAIRRAVEDRGDAVWISLDPLVPLGTAAEHCVQDLAVDRDLVELNRAGGVFAVLSVVGAIRGEPIHRILATAHPSGTQMTWR